MRCEGKLAVVTGSGGSMGGAIALRLAKEGADVVVNDRVAGRTDGIERDIRAMSRDVVAVHANVTRRQGAAAVIDAALDGWGRVDILVNVVGGMKGPHERAIWEITEEEWELAMGLNLRGTFHCTQLACRPMMECRHGKIVNIASVSWAGEPMHAHYAAAKAGVVAFTRSVATQLAPYDINVNAVAPGPMLSYVEGGPDRSDAVTPLGRVNEPRDIADAVLFLVSDEARNVSGQLLTVAGGANPAL
jgi:NAD(P)-dependent dehydrogenase (short-subunit alcohol dehydrogenase family)